MITRILEILVIVLMAIIVILMIDKNRSDNNISEERLNFSNRINNAISKERSKCAASSISDIGDDDIDSRLFESGGTRY